MKKLGLLLTILAMASSSLLTSCFSSSGSMEEPNMPEKQGFKGTQVKTDGTTLVTAVSKVVGLSGYAEVPKEAAQILVNKGWGGILVILSEAADSKVSTLADPTAITEHSFDAKTVIASCYPDGITFDSDHGVRLAVTTDQADGTNLKCMLNGSDESLDVTTDAKGAYVTLPHFCDWVFSLVGEVKIKSVDEIISDSIVHEVNAGDNVIKDECQLYGYRSDCTNPFVNSYVKQLIGTKKTYSYSYTNYHYVRGYDVYNLKQKVVTFDVVSGTKSFEFKAYGQPTIVNYHFRSWNHSGGSGSN